MKHCHSVCRISFCGVPLHFRCDLALSFQAWSAAVGMVNSWTRRYQSPPAQRHSTPQYHTAAPYALHNTVP
eukprot:3532253-Rhodomonas_salina.1